MKKVIRLTESDLTRLVRRTIMEMDRFKNYGEGPFSIGSADYEKNWETSNRELKQLSDSRKFHVPPYNPSSGRGWNKETLRSWVEENYGVELPDDLMMGSGIIFTDKISNWLEDNGYERLTEIDLTRIVKRTIREMKKDRPLFDIKAVDCDSPIEGHVDIDDDNMIVIRYCRGNKEDLEYLKEKGIKLLHNRFSLPDEDSTFGY